MIQSLFRITFLGALAYGTIACVGCGTVSEGTSEDDWMSGPPVSMSARLEYRVDSLTNENRRLHQQLEAIQAENNNLNSRLTELQAKPAEPAMTKPAYPASPVTTTKKSSLPVGYESALVKFRNRDFQGSIEDFKGLLAGGVSSDLADNCEYWIGESYLAMKKYTDAIESFKTVTTMEGADKADDAQLMIGNTYVAMGDKALAKQAFQKLITLYPTSPLAKRAQARMNNL